MNCAQHSPHSEFTAPSVNMDVVFGQICSALHVLQLWEFMPEEWRYPDIPDQSVGNRSSMPITPPNNKGKIPFSEITLLDPRGKVSSSWS